MGIRKQVYELSLEDFGAFPVWEFAADEEGVENQDEATVRPVETSRSVDPSTNTCVVLALFKLADGSAAHGYVTPSLDRSDLGAVQPVIVTSQGQVGLWCGAIAPSSDQINRNYAVLSKTRETVFPLSFASAVDIHGGEISGTVTGFLVLEDWRTGKVRVVA
jgi:hypothetical protein